MTKKIGLSAYVVRAKEIHARKWEVMALDGEMDIWSLLSDHLTSRRNEMVNLRDFAPEDKKDAVSRVFKITRLEADRDSCCFSCLAEAGSFGRSGKIVNTLTDQVVHRKKTNEADMEPFYFHIALADGDTRGILIAQQSGIAGCKSALEADLKRFFHSKDITFRTDLLTDKDLLDTYLTHGELTELSVVAHKETDDPREAMRGSRIDGEPIQTGTRMEVVIRGRKTLLGKMKTVAAVVRGQKKPRELVEVRGLENPDEVNVRVEMDGRARTFSITRADHAGISYDITDDVSYGSDNHPKFQSIDSIAQDWCKDLRRQLT